MHNVKSSNGKYNNNFTRNSGGGFRVFGQKGRYTFVPNRAIVTVGFSPVRSKERPKKKKKKREKCGICAYSSTDYWITGNPKWNL